MNVAIFGSTGQVGQHLVERALDRNWTVVAFAQSPSKLGALRDRVEVVEGTVQDAETVARAVENTDAVLSAVGHTASSAGNVLTVTAPHLIESMRRHDEIIVPAGDGAANWVDTRDIGELAAVVLAEGAEHDRCIYEPTGLSALDYHQVADVLSAVLGREITYERPSLRRYIRHMRTDTAFDIGFILFSCLLHTLVRLGRSERTTDDVESILGRPPRSLRDFAEDHAEVWT